MSEPSIGALNPAARSAWSARTITSLAMLTGLAYAVMLLSKMIPQVAGFLQIDLKDTIICIGGFMFGPLAAAILSILVAVIELVSASDTGPIGFLMNALSTCAFCCTASFVYHRRHTKRGALVGLALGVVVLTVVMLLWNYLITPFYMNVDRNQVKEMILPILLPFNLIKGGLNMALILLVYKPVVTALRRAHLVPESQKTTADGKTFSAGFLLFSLVLLATFVVFSLVLMGIL